MLNTDTIFTKYFPCITCWIYTCRYREPTILTGFLNTDKLARCLHASVESWREPSSWSRQASWPPWPHTLRNRFLSNWNPPSPGGSRRHVRLSKQANKLHMFGKLTRVTRALAPRLQKLRATAPGRKLTGRSEAKAEQQREAWMFWDS